MRIAILSRQPDLYSTRALAEAGEKRGHEVRVLDTLQFDLVVRRRGIVVRHGLILGEILR